MECLHFLKLRFEFIADLDPPRVVTLRHLEGLWWRMEFPDCHLAEIRHTGAQITVLASGIGHVDFIYKWVRRFISCLYTVVNRILGCFQEYWSTVRVFLESGSCNMFLLSQGFWAFVNDVETALMRSRYIIVIHVSISFAVEVN